MKIVKLFLVLGSLSLVSFTTNPKLKTEIEMATKTKILWEKVAISLGKIEQNKPVEIEFSFKNEGDSPVLITNVKPSCGCTVAKYTQEPIMPGKSGFIAGTFNAAVKGAFTKTVVVATNAEEIPKTLVFSGEVI